MSQINVDTIRGRTGGAPALDKGAVVTGVITATTLSGNVTGNVTGAVTGNATGLSGGPDVTVGKLTVNNDATVGGALTITGNFTVEGTQTIINTSQLDVEDKTVGVASTSSPTDVKADGAGLVVYGTSEKSMVWYNNSDAFTFSDAIDIKGAVETVTVGATATIPAGPKYVVLTCDAQDGTVFSHDVANGSVGILSLTNMPVTKNSVTTYTILFTQTSVADASGIGNTTYETGIGTNITLTPIGVSGFSTTALVSAGTTVILGTGNNDLDIVTIAVHYNGGGTGTATNYKTFSQKTGQFSLGAVGI